MFKRRIFPIVAAFVMLLSCFFAFPSSAAELSDEELSEFWDEVHKIDKYYSSAFFTQDMIDHFPNLVSQKLTPVSDVDLSLYFDEAPFPVFYSDTYLLEFDTFYLFSVSGDEIFAPLALVDEDRLVFDPMDHPDNSRNIFLFVAFGSDAVFFIHVWYMLPFYVIDDQNIIFYCPSSVDSALSEASAVYFVPGTLFEEYSSFSFTKLVEPDPPVAPRILSVFSTVAQAIFALIEILISLFYIPGTGLTFFGVLAVSGFSLSIVFLIICLIKDWLRLH